MGRDRRGHPLRVGIYAQGSSYPRARARRLRHLVRPRGFRRRRRRAARRRDGRRPRLRPCRGKRNRDRTPAVTGLDAVTAAASFPVVAPELARRPAAAGRSPHRRRHGARALRAGARRDRAGRARRPTRQGAEAASSRVCRRVSLDGVTAHELATQLGTVLAVADGQARASCWPDRSRPPPPRRRLGP